MDGIKLEWEYLSEARRIATRSKSLFSHHYNDSHGLAFVSSNLASNIDAFFCPGTIRGFASGRVSHYFGFQGPSIVLDTACSAGMVAVHSACQSLVLKECDSAIASGTNMLTSPEMFIGLSKGFFISNTGGCRTFDETADGYCRAEGVGVLVLKVSSVI